MSIIQDIFTTFTNIIISNNSRFKTIQKHKKLKEMIFYYLIDTNREYEKKDIFSGIVNLWEKCYEIGEDNFKCRTQPVDLFISILYSDFMPIVLKEIYNDKFEVTKEKSK
jgi:hypothetical protein